MTSIEWTDATWNPTVGCSRVSAGCQRCYAESVAHRGMSKQHRGLTVLGQHGPRWTGEVRFLPERLGVPLGWPKPRRIFVDSMSDLFHEELPRGAVAAVLGAMALCPHHTFQVLTKRPERMRDLLASISMDEAMFELCRVEPTIALDRKRSERIGREAKALGRDLDWEGPPGRMPWVFWGVSVEDQKTADERIPVLVDADVGHRFVSYEPALGPVDLLVAAFTGAESFEAMGGIDWVIVGGESGAGARPFDIEWARRTIAQCETAGVACFVKQLGGHPFYRTPIAPTAPADDRLRIVLKDRKGGDWDEWDADLRVREFPEVR